MERQRFDSVLKVVPVSGRKRRAISRELQSHLEDAQRDLVLAGWDSEAAARESISRLGDPHELADDFALVHARSRPVRVAVACGLALSMIMGAYGMGGSFASARSARHGSSPVRHSVPHHARTMWHHIP